MLGISIDSVAVQKAFCSSFGGISYPVLADFHPKGQVSQLYGVYNEERGTSIRSVYVIDKDGIIQFKKVYESGLPDPTEILQALELLG